MEWHLLPTLHRIMPGDFNIRTIQHLPQIALAGCSGLQCDSGHQLLCSCSCSPAPVRFLPRSEAVSTRIGKPSVPQLSLVYLSLEPTFQSASSVLLADLRPHTTHPSLRLFGRRCHIDEWMVASHTQFYNFHHRTCIRIRFSLAR